MENINDYSPKLKHMLSRIYRFVARHLNNEFTLENIAVARMRLGYESFCDTNCKFTTKFHTMVDEIKILADNEPYKIVEYSIELPDNDGKLKTRTTTKMYRNYDIKELEYLIKLDSTREFNYHTLKVFETNIQ